MTLEEAESNLCEEHNRIDQLEQELLTQKESEAQITESLLKEQDRRQQLSRDQKEIKERYQMLIYGLRVGRGVLFINVLFIVIGVAIALINTIHCR